MIRRLRATSLALVLSAACLAGSATAQTGPISGHPASLSEPDLDKSLRDLDPGVKVRRLPGGKTMYGLSVRFGAETHRVVVMSAPGQNRILMVVPLTLPLTPQAVPAGLEGQVVQFNQRPGPCRLEWYDHRDGSKSLLATLEIQRPGTTQSLQSQLTALLGNAEEARPVWVALRK